MKQHPVPQHIASYQFRLIGEMTVKQFLELALGLVGAWLLFSLKISPIIKFPLAFLSGITGAALAFLPLEERPLDRWILSFFRSVYSPTQYLWKKSNPIPDILKGDSHNNTPIIAPPKKIVKDSRELNEYLQTFNAPDNKNLDDQHLNHLEKINDLLSGNVDLVIKSIIPIPQPSLTKMEKTCPPIIKNAPPLAPPILVESTRPDRLDPAIAAQFSTTLPIPQMPEVPNLIVGMVLNDLGKIVSNALIEINNASDETVRALKTNKLGQFFCASPLANGDYQIKVEHPEHLFSPINIKTEGKIIPPLKIKAKKRTNYN